MAKHNLRAPQPTKAKTGRIPVPPATVGSTDDDTPVFCLRYLQKGFCLSDCERNEKAAFADALFRRRETTWNQLRQANRHGIGYEHIRQDSINAPIPPCITEDATLLAFRFNGKAPMVGFRIGRVFHVVWLDRQFTLYKHSN